MWLVTKDGFFNIVQDTKDKNILTLKARRWEDLAEAADVMGVSREEIEKSLTADYRFRLRAPIDSVGRYIKQLVTDIDYPKTKPRLSEIDPSRDEIYLAVWDTLSELQDERS